MITQFDNFTCKSFKNYTNPSDLLFREKNIFFGYNGKGKSASAIGIEREFLKDTSKKIENLRLFNKDYVSKSLLLENSDDKIKGIEANFGEGTVDVEKKIKELEKQIISEEEIEKFSSTVESIKKSTRKEIDSIHDRRKGKANIQKKAKDESVKKVIELYRNDYTEAKKIEKEDAQLLKINGDNSIEKQIAQFDSLGSLSLSDIPENDIDKIKKIYLDKYGDNIEIPEYEIVQWIDEGVKIHQESDIVCKFCGSKLDYLTVKSKLIQYKENKRHKAIKELKTFSEKLQTILKGIVIIEKTSKSYIAIIGDVIDEYFTTISSKKKDIEDLKNSLQTKIDNIEEISDFDFKRLASVINDTKNAISSITKEKEKQLKTLRIKQSNLTTLVKGAIGLEIISSSSIKDKLKQIETKEKELKTKKDSNKSKNEDIHNLKQQKSLTKDFANFVTQILEDINISLKVQIDIDNRNYIIKSANSEEEIPLTIKNISEGEKNLLALLFFYYELFNDDKQQKVKTEIELIIVDDPISSMDDSNKFYILELMKSLLELKTQQVFVLTHSWDDFCNLSYGKKAWDINSKYATFEIRKQNGKSELAQLKNQEKPYKYLFKEIFSFSQKRDTDISTECEIYHYPNVMRRVFEEWYSFKIGKDLNLTSSQQNGLANDFKITDTKGKTELGVLLKVCNILSHSINSSKNPQEIHQASKYLMKLIKENDPIHYKNMKE